MGKHGLEKPSRLQNVCINLKQDALVIRERQWSHWDFGPLERHYLRNTLISLDGWLAGKESVNLLGRFENLSVVGIVSDKVDRNLKYKAAEVSRSLRERQIQVKILNTGKNGKAYVAPRVTCGTWQAKKPYQGTWTTYKYSKGYTTPMPSARAGGQALHPSSRPKRGAEELPGTPPTIRSSIPKMGSSSKEPILIEEDLITNPRKRSRPRKSLPN